MKRTKYKSAEQLPSNWEEQRVSIYTLEPHVDQITASDIFKRIYGQVPSIIFYTILDEGRITHEFTYNGWIISTFEDGTEELSIIIEPTPPQEIKIHPLEFEQCGTDRYVCNYPLISYVIYKMTDGYWAIMANYGALGPSYKSSDEAIKAAQEHFEKVVKLCLITK